MIYRSLLSPVEIPEDVTLTEHIWKLWENYPDTVAIIDDASGRRFTYSELKQCILLTSRRLYHLGLRKGDVICMYSFNSPEFIIVFYAAVLVGVIVSPANALYTPHELECHVKLTESKVIFTQSKLLEKALTVQKSSPCVKEIITFERHDGHRSVQDFLDPSSGHSAAELPATQISPKTDIAILPTSSGTTGLPKCVMITHYNLMSSLEQFKHPLLTLMGEAEETVVFAMPFFHIFGIHLGMNMTLSLCNTLVIMERFQLRPYIEAVKKYKATVFPVVPPVIIQVLKDASLGRPYFSSVRRALVGAAPIGKGTLDQFLDKTGIAYILNGWGTTETSPLITIHVHSCLSNDNVGIVMPNGECKIVDVETSKSLGYMQKGEVCYRGPNVMKGYLKNPEATARTIDRDGWMHTGDIGYFDRRGNLFLTGRLKELIKYNGYQVAPVELETILLKHPAVADAAVIGVPDKSAGELPKAFIVKKPDNNVSPEDLVNYAAGLTAPQKRLRGGVVFIDTIPKTASGKILRRVLQQQVQTKHLAKL